MCKVNPVTKENIEAMKSSLRKRMENPSLTEEQLFALREQLDYVERNVRERTAFEPMIVNSEDASC